MLLNGFYEWKSDAGGKKQPYYIYMSSFASSPTSAGPGSPTKPAHPQTAVDEFVLPVAGLYDVATGEGSHTHTHMHLRMAHPAYVWCTLHTCMYDVATGKMITTTASTHTYTYTHVHTLGCCIPAACMHAHLRRR